MDRKSIIKFTDGIMDSTPLSQTEFGKLYGIKNKKNIRFVHVRIVYHIAIRHGMYPVCPYCKTQITSLEDFTIDHIIPKSKGGNGALENLQPMHRKCNLEKGSDIPDGLVEVPQKIHKKHRNKKQKKERDVIKCHSVEELDNKCKKIDQIRVNKCRSVGGRGSRAG